MTKIHRNFASNSTKGRTHVAGQDGISQEKKTQGSASSQKTGAQASSPSSGTSARAHHGRAKLYEKAKLAGPYISITFDDGPHPALTPKLLEILRDHDKVRATFFVVGKNVSTHPKLVDRLLTDGHAVGNHTYNHLELMPLRDEVVIKEITRTQEAIERATGFTPWLFRPPFGDLTVRQRELIERRLALKAIGWSIDPKDWKRPGPAVVADRILKAAHHGAIVICHDIQPGTIEAMPTILKGLRDKGYHFVTVNELRAFERGMGDWPSSSRKELPV
jgi:peptidoglycan-N-acetylglucosamine deacetylase